jgi:hypothetical protein
MNSPKLIIISKYVSKSLAILILNYSQELLLLTYKPQSNNKSLNQLLYQYQLMSYYNPNMIKFNHLASFLYIKNILEGSADIRYIS